MNLVCFITRKEANISHKHQIDEKNSDDQGRTVHEEHVEAHGRRHRHTHNYSLRYNNEAERSNISHANVSGLLTPVDWLFPTTATAVSPSRDRVRGTVFLLNSEHQTLGWRRSDAN